jgi:hypothetical protein
MGDVIHEVTWPLFVSCHLQNTPVNIPQLQPIFSDPIHGSCSRFFNLSVTNNKLPAVTCTYYVITFINFNVIMSFLDDPVQ